MYLPIIIIARGGSKRVPRKNVKPFCGKSITEWTIIQAKYSKMATDIILSTDDDEIAAIGEKHNIRIFRRPTMPDNTPGSIPIMMAIKKLLQEQYFEEHICLWTTNPLRFPYDMDNAISLYYGSAKEIKNSSVVSVIPLETVLYSPLNEKIKVINYKGIPYGMRDAGLFDITPIKKRLKYWKHMKIQEKVWIGRGYRRIARSDRHNIPYVVERWQSGDIDCQNDFDEIEYKFQKYLLDKGYYK